MTESSFMILQQIGVLPVDENSEIRFSIDAYRGYRYASIRKYLTQGTYTGATRAGITLTPDIVKAVAPAIANLPDDPAQLTDVELGKYAKRPGLSVIVRISSFRDTRGLDFRQWQEDEKYKGWTKKGIRLPGDKIKQIKVLFAQLAQALAEKPLEEF